MGAEGNMSNVVKPNSVGIDKPIADLQTYLYGKLITKWGLSDSTLNMYGRAYNNATSDGYQPEVYVGNNEYNEVFYDDRFFATSFFGRGEEVKVSPTTVIADVFLIFMLNLAQVKPGINRNDEECHVDVQQLITPLWGGFTCTGIITGIEKVFAEYSGWRRSKAIKFTDTHPQHCFRLNFKLLYNPYKNC